MPGQELLETIRTLAPEGAAAVLLRHAERFPIIDPAVPSLAEITPGGAVAAEGFGAQIAGFDAVRIFHSPVRRCQQTAECLARGAASAGLAVDLIGPQPTLGIDYIYDLPEAARLSTLHGRDFVRLWFSGRIPDGVIRPAAQIAAAKLAYLTRQLAEPAARGRRLDLHVSHDWNIIVLRELMLHVRHEEAGWLTFLDGMTFASRAAGLRASYRDHIRSQPLPWKFEGVGLADPGRGRGSAA